MIDRIKNIILNKFFIFFIIFIAVLFSFCSISFAVVPNSYSISHNSITTIIDLSYLSNDYDYIFIAYSTGNNSLGYIFLSNSPFEYYSNKLYTADGSNHCKVNNVFFDGGTFTVDSNTSILYSQSSGRSYDISVSSFFYSNHNITDRSGNVVFQEAPLPQGETQQENNQGNSQEVEQTQGTQQEGTQQGEIQQQEIPTIATAEQILQAIIQTFQILIPVGLVVFGIGLVVYLMRLLILRLM